MLVVVVRLGLLFILNLVKETMGCPQLVRQYCVTNRLDHGGNGGAFKSA
jgi:hypothetical protein